MKLSDLRERMKAAYPAARSSYASMTSDRANMRELWVEIGRVVDLNDQLPGDGGLHPSILRFHRAGQLYYHAKKHGVRSAMMMRLQME
jgi:hypothetical protein